MEGVEEESMKGGMKPDDLLCSRNAQMTCSSDAQ